MMRELFEGTRKTIERYGLLSGGETVVVGVSGGADSIALLHILAALVPALRLRLHVAHLHHGLRPEADEDARFVVQAARAVGAPCTVERVDVAALARAQKRSVEDAGRAARYALFTRTARAVGAERIAVGHTRDDQIETVLMRLLQGAPWELLAGMPPRRGEPPAVIIRPLLETPREMLRVFLRTRGLSWREDPTNRDLSIPRNHLRWRVLPALVAERAQWPDVLWRTGETARLCDQVLDRLSGRLYGHLRRAGEGGVVFALDALRALPPAVCGRLLRRAAAEAVGTSRPLPRVLEDRMLRAVSAGRAGAEVAGGGVALRMGYGVVEVGPARPAAVPEAYRLDVPGEVLAASFGIVFSAALEPPGPPVDDPAEAVLDAACVEPPLVVRAWRPGDVFRPLGMPGKKKVQDFFVDARVPRWRRAWTPLVVDRRGEVVWIVGQRIAEPCRVRPETRQVLHLRARPA